MRRRAADACMKETAMIHKFHVGQRVRFSGSVSHHAAAGSYEVTGRLPPRDNGNQYRIKSAHEPHQRVVNEDDLQPERQQNDPEALFAPRPDSADPTKH